MTPIIDGNQVKVDRFLGLVDIYHYWNSTRRDQYERYSFCMISREAYSRSHRNRQYTTSGSTNDNGETSNLDGSLRREAVSVVWMGTAALLTHYICIELR